MEDVFVCRYRSPSPEEYAKAEERRHELNAKYRAEFLANPISEQEKQEISERLRKVFNLGE